MPTVAATVGGIVAGFFSGIFGSLFTVPTREGANLSICVQEWAWANTWLFFTIFNVLVNLILAQAVFGLDVVHEAYANVPKSAQLAVLLSSALWSLGKYSITCIISWMHEASIRRGQHGPSCWYYSVKGVSLMTRNHVGTRPESESIRDSNTA